VRKKKSRHSSGKRDVFLAGKKKIALVYAAKLVKQGKRRAQLEGWGV